MHLKTLYSELLNAAGLFSAPSYTEHFDANTISKYNMYKYSSSL